MIERIITGGQTGADQAGWRAARQFGIKTGGWMPKGFLTEDGSRPEFAELYGAKETESRDYVDRTRRNARDADATLWFGNPESRGGKATRRACYGPYLCVWPGVDKYNFKHEAITMFVREYRVVNIAGNRESGAAGIGVWVEAYLCEVFRHLGIMGVHTL